MYNLILHQVGRMVLLVDQKQGLRGIVKQEADARMIYKKQLLNRCFVLGNKGIKGKVFLKSNVLCIVGAAVAGFLFFSATAARRFREQGDFFKGPAAVMCH